MKEKLNFKSNGTGSLFPQPPPLFIGRDRDIEFLFEGFTRFNVVFLAGFSGIGKTCVASSLANHLHLSETAIVLWINVLKGWDTDTLLYNILDMLNSLSSDFPSADEFFMEPSGIESQRSGYFLRRDGVDYQRQERILNFISVINDLGLAIFIDDFENIPDSSAREIIELFCKYLRGSNIVFIGRKTPDLDIYRIMDLFIFSLNLLDMDASIALIENYCKTFNLENLPDEVSESIWLSSRGHPYLIKSAMGALIMRQASNFAYSPFMVSSEYLESAIFENLTDNDRIIVNQFSVLRKPITLSGLQHIIANKDIHQSLEKLKNRFVVDVDIWNNYSMHQLFREAVRKSIPQERLIKLHIRCASYYESLPKMDNYDRTGNLNEAFYHYMEAAEYDRALELFYELYRLLRRLCRFAEIKQMIDQLEAVTIFLPDEILIAKAEVERLNGNFAEFEIALVKIGKPADQKIQVLKLIEEVKLEIFKGNFEEALKIALKAKRKAKKQRDFKLVLKTLDMMGAVYLSLRNNSKAKYVFEKRLAGLDRCGDPCEKAEVLFNLATISNREERFSDAVSLLNKAISLLDPEKDKRLISMINGELGISFVLSDKYDKAKELFSVSYEYGNKYGDLSCKLAPLCNLGFVSFLLGETEEGEKKLKEGAQLYLSWGNKPKYIFAEIYRALMYESQGKIDEALRCIYDALPVAEEISLKRLEISLRLHLSEIFLSESRIDEAFLEVNRAFSLIDRLRTYDAIDPSFLCHLLFAEIHYRLGEMEEFHKYVDALSPLKKSVSLRNRMAASYFLSVCGLTEWCGEKLSADTILKEIETLSHYNRVILKYSMERYMKLGTHDKKIIIVTAEGISESGYEQLENIRKRKDGYNLWIDCIKGEYFDKVKGKLDLDRKRTLLPLLEYFIKNAGRGLTAPELFLNVWESEYDKRLNYNTLRSSIARLREIIEADQSNPYYIQTARSYKPGETSWVFNKSSCFCYINFID